jgi:hypothetical protein
MLPVIIIEASGESCEFSKGLLIGYCGVSFDGQYPYGQFLDKRFLLHI